MTTKRLTPKASYALYLRVWPDDDPWPLDNKPDQRQLDIIAEVRKMLAAPTLDAAFDVCDWWICEGDDDAKRELRGAVARLRRMKP